LSDALLIFLDAHNEIEGWLRVAGNAVTARGRGLEGLPGLTAPASGAPIRVAAIVPGEAVTLHWLEVPAGLAPAQAAAAARLMAGDVSAQPLGDMHVAVGPEAEDGALRAVAVVPAITMAGWLGKLQAQALDPDVVLPEPLLLRAPREGYVRHERGGLPLYRGPADAFSVEPELAELIVADRPVQPVDEEAFEGGLGDAIGYPAVNLRQGVFAKRRRWAIKWALVRRLAMLAVALAAVTLAIQVAAIFKYTLEADALELEANRVAATALQRNGPVTDGSRQLERRLTELGGAGPGYSAMASAVFGAVRDTPNVELTGLFFDQSGAMRATVQADSPATLASFQQRIEASGFAATAGEMRGGGGRPTADVTVRAR
jgi:general secretion pathway protein L